MSTVTVSGESDGMRLDRFVRRRLSGMPLAAIFRNIRKGAIRINGKKARQNTPCRQGDEITLPDTAPPPVKPGTGKHSDPYGSPFYRKNLHVVFEDEHLLAVDKPCGITVHSGTDHPEGRTLIDLAASYIMHSGKQSGCGPFLVHRLDRDTSGIIILAKRAPAARALSAVFRSHHAKKRYLAICHGVPPAASGTLRMNLNKTYARNNGMKMVVGNEGESAVTHYRLLKTNRTLSKLAIRTDTGKTHQIRVHLAHTGCPILGDRRYGDRRRDRRFFQARTARRRLYLHAHRILLPHPATGDPFRAEAPVPAEFDIIAR